MMNRVKVRSLFGKKIAAVLCIISFCLMLSRPAYATCEPPGVAAAALQAGLAALKAELAAFKVALKADYEITSIIVRETLSVGTNNEEPAGNSGANTGLTGAEGMIVKRIDEFWNRWFAALQNMTKQIHGAAVDESRQDESLQDGSNLASAALRIQKLQTEARKKYQPSETGCRFDTTAKYLGRSRENSAVVTTGYALDFNKIGNNAAGTPSATGQAPLIKSRWEIYKNKFCDKNSNNGKAGCTAVNPMANAHIMPGKTLFEKDTIDMNDADTREAVNQLMFNITGYEPTDPVLASAQKSAEGQQRRRESREYLARMDAIGALAYSVVSDGVPGDQAPEIQESRKEVLGPGNDARTSDHPSAREIRHSIVEQIRNPNYFKSFYEAVTTITPKEVYLQSYNVMLLYDMIAKQEKISNIYAIQTADLLNKTDGSRHNASSSAPLK